MTPQSKTDTTKLMYFIMFVMTNLVGYFLIPFAVDYAHNFLNGLIIPTSLLRDQSGALRADKTNWFTAQVIVVVVEWIGCLWLLYRFNRSNTRIWVDNPPSFAQLLPIVTTVIVGILTLFGRGGFLIRLIEHYINAVV